MTIQQRVERMFNPGGSTPTGVPVTAVAFASLPPAASVPRQIRTISDVGPAPGIELISNGTIWRPRGGRQVLAMRTLNPVTVQALNPGQVAETIGPFPGGLVRAGMSLEVRSHIIHTGIGAGTRAVLVEIGNGAPWGVIHAGSTTQSGTEIDAHISVTISPASDGYSLARGGTASNSSFGYGLQERNFYIDFSLPWSFRVSLTSAAETAVNITSASWVAGIATFGTSAAHTLAVGDKTVIAGVTPSGYNVAAGAIVLSVPTTTSFTVAIASDPGAYTSGGTSSRISNMVSQSYVLSLIG